MKMHKAWFPVGLLVVFLGLPASISALTDKYRIMWREDPATSMVIAWNQVSGHSPRLYYDTEDHGQNYEAYATVTLPSRVVQAKGMNNHFVRLNGLKPHTTYYFLIVDSEGMSRRFFFTTAPDSPVRVAIVAGGDSRNNREARRDANLLVAKLRPLCVMFGGDMTASDVASEWKNWFDDWQLTIAEDGRMTPVLVTRGNHEASNKSLVDLFDIPSEEAYYALSIGGNLLRIYTLNSLIAVGGKQKQWLENDLKLHRDVIWKIAQYHFATRPHTARKKERNEQFVHWSSLFYQYGVQLVVESDAHDVKTTWPIRPALGPDSHQGFVRDDLNGTVYVGEGCWGAPLRPADDLKPWTRAAGSFNQFKWLWIGPDEIEIRTVRVNGASGVASVPRDNPFQIPRGLTLWNPPTGDVVVINRQIEDPFQPYPSTEEELVSREGQTGKASSEASAGMEIWSFEVRRFGTGLKLFWVVYNEPAGLEYELQRSEDGGQTFKTIGELKGRGLRRNEYEYADSDLSSVPGKKLRYRLRYHRANGTTSIFNPKQEAELSASSWERFPKLVPDTHTGRVKFAYELKHTADVQAILLDLRLKEITSMSLTDQPPGKYLKAMDLTVLPPGRYLLVVRADGRVIRRYRVQK